MRKYYMYNNISFMLDPCDTPLYYSDGSFSAEKEEDSVAFGKQNLSDKLRVYIYQPSKENVQTIAQSIIEYINYALIRDGILLTSIKRL
ncbi:MAG TPA: hypothetical protein PK624_11445 [Spirochaetota bacterium]|nr:hypothetical protein [Spirochaetota bacterium]HPK57103.1 hypothetical protein [Spirochaetota bacterium]